MIFLATSQWFIGLDRPLRDNRPLRDAALGEVTGRSVDSRLGPRWIRNMVATDLIGVFPVSGYGGSDPGRGLYQLRRSHADDRARRKGGEVFETYGADAWYERPTEEFVPAGLTCPACGGSTFEREMNILDVWFDSGSSHEAVLSVRPDLTWPADIYLEGSDQHRGWFQSSLLVGLGREGTRRIGKC